MSAAIFPITFSAPWLGRSFKEFSSEVLHTTHHEVVRRWFHSEHDAELFIWTDVNKRILKQQFFCFGQVVEWNIVEGVRTGMAFFDETRVEDVETLHFDPRPQASSLSQACEVLKRIECLVAPEREQLIANFTHGKRSPLGRELGVGPAWLAALVRPANRTSFSNRLVTRIKAWFKL